MSPEEQERREKVIQQHIANGRRVEKLTETIRLLKWCANAKPSEIASYLRDAEKELEYLCPKTLRESLGGRLIDGSHKS